jgi:hypothetical protein
MITDNLFQSNRTDCNLACIKSSALSSNATQSFPLPDVNNTLVNVTARLSPTLVDGMFISIDYKSIYSISL